MKNYAVLEGMKRQSKDVIECAFNKGYEQGYQDGKGERETEYKEALHNIENTYIKGQKAEYDRGYKEGKEAAEDDMCKYYNKHFNDVVNSSNDDAYQRGYEDGRNEILTIKVFEEYYQKGLKHGQELRAKEAECAEACGMKRAWQAVRKIIDMPLADLDELFPGWDVEHIIEKLSAKEVIEKVEAWEKQEQTEKNCNTCKNDGWSIECACCGGVDTNYSKWTPKKDAPETNVESIEVWDEVKDNFGNKLLVTHVYSECRNVDTMDTDGRFERFPSECLKKTGRRYQHGKGWWNND